MRDGLHNFWDTCTITDHHRAVRNFETRYGYFELRARVPDDSGLHSAWWMIGTEAKSDETAEVDIFEICGPDINTDQSRVRVSVHPWNDAGLSEQSLDYYPACDVSQDFHVYGFEWQPEGMKFYFDGNLVKETSQSPDYKMITFLGIYENDSPLWSGRRTITATIPRDLKSTISAFTKPMRCWLGTQQPIITLLQEKIWLRMQLRAQDRTGTGTVLPAI